MPTKRLTAFFHSLSLLFLETAAGLMIALAVPAPAFAAEQPLPEAAVSTDSNSTPASEERGPGVQMAPEGLGSEGEWTSSATLLRILGPGEDPEHPRFYHIVNGRVKEIIIR